MKRLKIAIAASAAATTLALSATGGERSPAARAARQIAATISAEISRPPAIPMSTKAYR